MWKGIKKALKFGAMAIGACMLMSMSVIACLMSNLAMPTLVLGSMVYASSMLLPVVATRALMVGAVGILTCKALCAIGTGIREGIEIIMTGIVAFSDDSPNSINSLRVAKKYLRNVRENRRSINNICKDNTRTPLFNINNKCGRDLDF